MSANKSTINRSPLITLLRCLFFGEDVLEIVHSPYNGTLKVNRDVFGHLGIIGGGISQSGGMTESIYRQAIAYMQKNRLHPKTVLILGFGAGTFTRLLKNVYPEAVITGIDIDPLIVDLGRRYFYVDTIPGLSIQIADAYQYLITDNRVYDLIFIDLYQGQQIPVQFTTPFFLNQVKKRLNDASSIALFNRLNWSIHKKTAATFFLLLKSHFQKVTPVSLNYNLLFFCSG